MLAGPICKSQQISADPRYPGRDGSGRVGTGLTGLGWVGLGRVPPPQGATLICLLLFLVVLVGLVVGLGVGSVEAGGCWS